MSARGGRGWSAVTPFDRADGGGGSGGRIRVEYDNATYVETSASPLVAGGLAFASGTAGANGQFVYAPLSTPIP